MTHHLNGHAGCRRSIGMLMLPLRNSQHNPQVFLSLFFFFRATKRKPSSRLLTSRMWLSLAHPYGRAAPPSGPPPFSSGLANSCAPPTYGNPESVGLGWRPWLVPVICLACSVVDVLCSSHRTCAWIPVNRQMKRWRSRHVFSVF